MYALDSEMQKKAGAVHDFFRSTVQGRVQLNVGPEFTLRNFEAPSLGPESMSWNFGVAAGGLKQCKDHEGLLEQGQTDVCLPESDVIQCVSSLGKEYYRLRLVVRRCLIPYYNHTKTRDFVEHPCLLRLNLGCGPVTPAHTQITLQSLDGRSECRYRAWVFVTVDGALEEESSCGPELVNGSTGLFASTGSMDAAPPLAGSGSSSTTFLVFQYSVFRTRGTQPQYRISEQRHQLLHQRLCTQVLYVFLGVIVGAVLQTLIQRDKNSGCYDYLQRTRDCQTVSEDRR
ncbi:hypothetical protein R3P38DRAFT_3431976 [Favolaschia claudopus]|uniref:Uncharacterized protein n=1 Tax=Favolaschia claudopus TaxID=2862362 RepID=A0AAW0CWA0_9AGAR